MSVTIDSSVYKHTFYGILNAQGEFWTPIPFYDSKDAQAYLKEFVSKDRDRFSPMLRTHKIVPVRIQLTSLAAPVGRNAKRQDPQGLGPKDEHAVTAKPAGAQNNSEGPSNDR